MWFWIGFIIISAYIFAFIVKKLNERHQDKWRAEKDAAYAALSTADKKKVDEETERYNEAIWPGRIPQY